jgi:hypothetical protein
MKKTFTLFILLFVMAGQIFAIPANPTPRVFIQPNGEELTIIMRGDERIHWSETLDGYTLLYNNEKYLTYAQLDEDGNLMPSEFIATDIEKRDFAILAFLNSIETKLWFSDAQKQMMLQIWEIEDEAANSRGADAVIGEYKSICAFVRFPEKNFVKTMAQFEPLFNQNGYTGNGTGSVRDYFKESSYDQFGLTITLCGIYEAPKSESYYAGNNGNQNCQELARWAAEQVAAEPSINFADYCGTGSNQNRVSFHFIFAGMAKICTAIINNRIKRVKVFFIINLFNF